LRGHFVEAFAAIPIALGLHLHIACEGCAFIRFDSEQKRSLPACAAIKFCKLRRRIDRLDFSGGWDQRDWFVPTAWRMPRAKSLRELVCRFVSESDVSVSIYAEVERSRSPDAAPATPISAAAAKQQHQYDDDQD
jgi:hypothetical protein